MLDLFTESQQIIRQGIEGYFDSPDNPLQETPFWGEDLRGRLREYTLRGKLIRGSLVPFTYCLFHAASPGTPPAVPEGVVKIGVAMELLQSFLLIHDDIMDQDDLRRGLPAIHRQYREITPGTAESDASKQYGLSMGICAGDIGAFLALQLLSSVDLPEVIRGKIISRVTSEIVLVGLAQMQDVHHGYVTTAGSEAVLNVYTYKTGRYTFSLPMLAGAIVADASPEDQNSLVTLGEQLGRIFQIMDDRLGLFGDSSTIGKPGSGDVREDKKTLYRELLFQKIPTDDSLRAFFGNAATGAVEMEQVRLALIRTGVIDEVHTIVTEEAAKARNGIASLSISPAGKASLEALLEYNLNRAV